MTLYSRRPEVGDGVVLPTERTATRVNSYTRDVLRAGTQFTITRAYTDRVQVRTVERFPDPYGGGPAKSRSYTFGKEELNYDDTAVATTADGRPTRRLGKKPEDTEEMTYIGPDHPGIQWLFEDMGKFATEQQYCNQYDALCARLGIPGRPRPFTVAREVKGITLSTTVNARSQAEANRMVDLALGLTQPEEGPSEETPESENTPADPRFAPAA